MALLVDIGVFAHNEAECITALAQELLAQDLLQTVDFDVRILVLANGCTDDTAKRARDAGNEIGVVELDQGGKSRTWNRFVHDLARSESDILIFMDADIAFPEASILRRLVKALAKQPSLWVLNSRPVKDIVAYPGRLNLTERLIAAAGGGLGEWKTSICGQLYAMPAARARAFHLPVGLPVEDGFLRAMVLTDVLTVSEDFRRIDGLEDIFHIYYSERRIKDLLRHQTRIIIGSAVNSACFEELCSLPAGSRARALFNLDDTWLDAVIRKRLPRWPSGYVPIHFAIKRVQNALLTPRSLLSPKRLLLTTAGFCFDLIVYMRAQFAMARGTGAGYW